MSAVLKTPLSSINFAAMDAQIDAIRNWSAPVIEARKAEKTAMEKLNEIRAERDRELFSIRCAIKGFSAGLQANELLDLICALREGASPHLVEAKKSLLDLSCDLEGVMYGSEQ